jgi:iron complex outermembrane receptor protein
LAVILDARSFARGEIEMTRELASALATATAIVALATPARAQEPVKDYHIAAGMLQSALDEWARQSGRQIIYRSDEIRGAVSPGAHGALTADAALSAILAGSGFGARADQSGAVAIVRIRSAQDAAPADQQTASIGELAAQEVPPNTEIVVTGSNIRGVTPASPRIVIDRKAIERSGLATVEQVINRLPQQFAGSASENTNGGLTGSAQSGFNVSNGTGLDLRGLGTDSTLVLINGHRVASTGIGNFVDLSLIPLSAVERIDIVPDGASAIYGSDAVGGVANFILRKNLDGAETRARVGTVTSGDTREFQFGQLVGKTWSTGNVIASYEYYHRGDLGVSERSFSKELDEPFDLLPSQKRHSAYLNVNQQLNDNVELFADALYANRKSRSDFTFAGLPPDAAGGTTKQLGFTAGSRIHAGRWLVEAVGSTDHNKTDQLSILASDFTGRSTSFDLKGDGPVFHIPGGDVRVAAGAQWRHETLSRERLDPTQNLDFSVKSKRSVWAAYGEGYIPIVGDENASPGLRRLEASVAGRYDHYSDFGQTFNVKLGLLWSPADGLKVRSTYSTAFRAPLLFQLDESSVTYIPFPAQDPESPTGTTNAVIIQGGNANLKPEKARIFSAGIDFSKSSSPFGASVNFFNIDFRNRIGDPPILPLLLVGLDEPTISSFIRRDVPQSEILDLASKPTFLNLFGIPLDQITAIGDFRTANLARTRVRGLDASARYRIDSHAGLFELALNATYLIDHKTQFTPTSPFEELVSTRFNPVNLRGTATLGWSRGGWSTNAFVNYVNSYKDPSSVPGQVFHIDSWTTVDLAAQYDTGNRPRSQALRNLVVSATVLNLFDKDPPFIRSTEGLHYDGSNATPLGRFVAAQLTKRW